MDLSEVKISVEQFFSAFVINRLNKLCYGEIKARRCSFHQRHFVSAFRNVLKIISLKRIS